MDKGFLVLLILAAVHFFASQNQFSSWIWQGRFLSFASGISFAYIFVELLPALAKGQPILKETFQGTISWLDKHSYIIALLGFLFYYGLYTQSKQGGVRNFWLSMTGYLIFNFFIGASLFDSTNPDIQPIALFTFAMGMHYFVNDHNIAEDHPELFKNQARWMLVGILILGYCVGFITQVPDSISAIAISFVAGGVLLNSIRNELPKREQIAYAFFVLGSLSYAALILLKGMQ